jgi:hypothetical protein
MKPSPKPTSRPGTPFRHGGTRLFERAGLATNAAVELPPRLAGLVWNESLALAGLTGVPELVFPLLLEEKLASAVRRNRRQRRLLERTGRAFSA